MDFRLHLQNELATRCARNPRYSLRSFAHSLGIGSSDLSKILRGRRRLTDGAVLRLGTRLGLTPDQLDACRQALKANRTRTIGGASAANDETPYQQLSLDSFHLVGDWYHMAILELMKVRGFKPDAAWIAQQLDITVNEANIAVERLMRLGLLSATATGRWIDRAGATSSVTNEYTDAAKKRLQRQILAKAADAMDDVPISARDQSAIVMAVNKKNLPAAKELIRDFRRKLCELLEAGSRKEQVYYLTVSLFPVTGTEGTP